jgi:hypothetical protein
MTGELVTLVGNTSSEPDGRLFVLLKKLVMMILMII